MNRLASEQMPMGFIFGPVPATALEQHIRLEICRGVVSPMGISTQLRCQAEVLGIGNPEPRLERFLACEL